MTSADVPIEQTQLQHEFLKMGPVSSRFVHLLPIIPSSVLFLIVLSVVDHIPMWF